MVREERLELLIEVGAHALQSCHDADGGGVEVGPQRAPAVDHPVYGIAHARKEYFGFICLNTNDRVLPKGMLVKKVLMVVADPATSTTTGWPAGFWASELFHPWYEFREAGYDVTVASPSGGKVELDAMSDPRDESRYSADDVLSLGFLSSPELMAALEDTPALADLDLEPFDAIVVCGGQSPMFTFRDDAGLQSAIARFYESGRATAALCHGRRMRPTPQLGRR